MVSDYPVRIQLLIGFSHLCKVEFLSLWMMNAFQKGLLLRIDFRIDSSTTTENEGRESGGGGGSGRGQTENVLSCHLRVDAFP